MSKVIATAPGYDGVLRAVGDVFDAPKGKDGKEITKSNWFKPAGKVVADKPSDGTGNEDGGKKDEGGKKEPALT